MHEKNAPQQEQERAANTVHIAVTSPHGCVRFAFMVLRVTATGCFRASQVR